MSQVHEPSPSGYSLGRTDGYDNLTLKPVRPNSRRSPLYGHRLITCDGSANKHACGASQGSSGSRCRPVHPGTHRTKLIAMNVKRHRQYHQVKHQSFRIVSYNAVATVPLAILVDQPIIVIQASVRTCDHVLCGYQWFASVQKGTPGL